MASADGSETRHAPSRPPAPGCKRARGSGRVGAVWTRFRRREGSICRRQYTMLPKDAYGTLFRTDATPPQTPSHVWLRKRPHRCSPLINSSSSISLLTLCILYPPNVFSRYRRIMESSLTFLPAPPVSKKCPASQIQQCSKYPTLLYRGNHRRGIAQCH